MAYSAEHSTIDCHVISHWGNAILKQLQMSNEQKYQFALWEAGLPSTDKQLWLEDHFELYKTTLIWPPGLPPIRTCNMPEGTIRESFHSTYKMILSEFDYEFDNENRTLEFD